MIEFETIHSDEENPTGFSRDDIAEFLFHHLDKYGDSKSAILKCIGYAYGDKPGQNGFILVAHENNEIAGAVIVNETNMSEYIPENILVYIAVHKKARGKGIGKQLMKKTIETTTGDIALHVEADNPAKILYEKVGFSSKYLEMRRPGKQ